MIHAEEERRPLAFWKAADGVEHGLQASLAVQPRPMIDVGRLNGVGQRHFPPSAPDSRHVRVARNRQQVRERRLCLDVRGFRQQAHVGFRDDVLGEAAVAAEAPGEPEDGRRILAVERLDLGHAHC